MTSVLVFNSGQVADVVLPGTSGYPALLENCSLTSKYNITNTPQGHRIRLSAASLPHRVQRLEVESCKNTDAVLSSFSLQCTCYYFVSCFPSRKRTGLVRVVSDNGAISFAAIITLSLSISLIPTIAFPPDGHDSPHCHL